MNYKLTLNPDCVFRISDSAYITRSEANFSWDEYTKWLSEGNTPLPAIEPVVEEPAPVVEAPVVTDPVVDEAPPVEPNEG
jgi:hypothetical protein